VWLSENAGYPWFMAGSMRKRNEKDGKPTHFGFPLFRQTHVIDLMQHF